MNKNLKKNRKFTALIFMPVLSFSMFLYYRLVAEISYSTDYNTVGTVTKIEFEEDSQNSNKYNLEIEYEDSKKNKVTDQHLIYEESDEYKKLEVCNPKVGREIKIRTEEGVAEGFFGKRILYSTIMEILIYSPPYV